MLTMSGGPYRAHMTQRAKDIVPAESGTERDRTNEKGRGQCSEGRLIAY